jgi:hypothetical protein
MLYEVSADAVLQVSQLNFLANEEGGQGADRDAPSRGRPRVSPAAMTIVLVIPGPVDDALLLAGWSALAVVWAVKTVNWDVLGKLLSTRIARLLVKPKNRLCEQYSLRAATNGVYFDWRRGFTYLRAGDVWKYGESVKGQKRYWQPFYDAMGVYYWPEYSGTKTQCEIMERMKIYNYEYVHGRLPPGNLIRK